MLVLDSGGLSRLAARTKPSLAIIRALTSAELWPPIVPTVILLATLFIGAASGVYVMYNGMGHVDAT
mgnify:CR=1 FL=1